MNGNQIQTVQSFHLIIYNWKRKKGKLKVRMFYGLFSIHSNWLLVNFKVFLVTARVFFLKGNPNHWIGAEYIMVYAEIDNKINRFPDFIKHNILAL